MNRPDERDREIAELRERLTRLSEASLRINESLDFDVVLQGVLDSARSLTGAQYGVITLLDDTGRVEDFLSSGMTAGEADELWVLPGGSSHFEYLGSISGPLRVPDLLSHIRSLGLPELSPPVEVSPAVPFLASPIFHRDERVGNIYVAEKEAGAEFTPEDEETLVMFASQAALVISNARRYRDEQRARADLETLVNTSPVGVVVFNTGTAAPVSFNREARRIVDGLREPEQSPEQLLENLIFRRADGREVSLMELPLSELLSTGETVRAEEIVLTVPDGRSVTALLNATPIRSEDGEVESLVVTLQDMTPLEELERLRAEFLGMVSHELRTPLTSIKGSATTLLEASSELDPAEMTQFFRIIRDQADQMRHLIGDLLDVARIETGTLSVSPGPADVAEMVDDARSRFLNEGGRENLHFDLPSDLPPVMADRRRTVQVLNNLLSNAARYSPEGSPIQVSAVREGVHVAVSVADEGRGLSEDLLPQLFRKFSRIDGGGRGSDIAGSGLGLAISKGIVEAHGGRIWAESEGPGLGARFTFTLPLVDGEGFAGPATRAPTSIRSRPSSKGKLRVLAVDDDPQALRYIRDTLTKAGYAPIVTGDPEEVPRLVKEEKPHLVLLDLMLPGSDGIELMKDILKSSDVPIIFVSVYGQDEVIARAFDLGAADYVVKPFSPTELVARIRAAMRKRVAPYMTEPSEPYSTRELHIDYPTRRVTVAGRPVELTATEYSLLFELSVNVGRVLTHDYLLHRVWGPDRTGAPWLVRDVVKRLRRKLDDDADNPKYIFTEPRVGYRMVMGETQEGLEAE